MSSVIIYGPTGNVGSATAIAAHELGAKVFLAGRDISKPIPGLTDEQAAPTRVKADLTDPASVTQSVKSSGATRAFVYLVPPGPSQVPDHMLSTFQALKDGGIEFVGETALSLFALRFPTSEMY